MEKFNILSNYLHAQLIFAELLQTVQRLYIDLGFLDNLGGTI
jgi:hypothetical protein